MIVANGMELVAAAQRYSRGITISGVFVGVTWYAIEIDGD
jgi:hypothetical protein